MAVEIGRGRVACLRRSGDRGFEGNSSSEAEAALGSMEPTALLLLERRYGNMATR